MKRPIVTVVIVIVVAIIAFFVGCHTCIEKPMQTNFPGAEKHEVTLSEAVKYVQNYRNNPQMIKTHGGSLNRAIFDKILAQPDCDGIRFYYAQNEDGSPTMVFLGITATGKDMVKGTLAEMISPCPPFCDGASDFR
jgi:hypothetical protein